MKHIDYTNATWDEIISASQNNDEDAKKELVEKTYKVVANTCKKYTHGETEVTKDLIQDVYLKVFKNLSTIKDPVAFPRWIKMVACNTCQDYLRSLKNNRVDYFAPGENEEEVDPYETFADQDHQVDPDKKLDTKETRNMMNEIIHDLPDSQRAVIVMYYYDDLSVKDIAEVTNVSENTVKSRLNYARQKIKECVAEYEKKYNIRLHGVAPVSFLTYIRYFLQADSSDVLLAAKLALPTAAIINQVAGTTVAGVVEGAVVTEAVGKAGLGIFLKGALSTVSAKAIVAVASVIVVSGSLLGISYLHNNKEADSPVTEEISAIQVVENTSNVNETSMLEESSSQPTKTTATKENSKTESSTSSTIEDSSSSPVIIEESSFQEESSEAASSVPEDSSVVVSEESSNSEESSTTVIEESSAPVIEESSSSTIEESSFTTPEESSKEESIIETCTHQLYYCTFHRKTCEQASYYENLCYDCGLSWTEPCEDALGGTCELPTEPWLNVGDTFTVTRGFMFAPEETYQDIAFKYCPKCYEGYTRLDYTGVLNPGYYVDGTYFDSFSDAETYATENNIPTYTVQYTVTSIDSFITVTAPSNPMKLPAENRPPV